MEPTVTFVGQPCAEATHCFELPQQRQLNSNEDDVGVITVRFKLKTQFENNYVVILSKFSWKHPLSAIKRRKTIRTTKAALINNSLSSQEHAGRSKNIVLTRCDLPNSMTLYRFHDKFQKFLRFVILLQAP